MRYWLECKMLQSSGKQLSVSYKTNHAINHKTQQLHSCAHLSQRDENVCSHKNQHTNVYTTLICNNPNLEMT